MRRVLEIVRGGWLAVLLSGTFLATPAGAVERLRLHAAFPSQLPLLGSFAGRFAEAAGGLSQGRLKVRHFEPGALLPRFGYLDAVARGGVDAAWGTPAVAGGRKPAMALFTGMPFGLDMAQHRAWMAADGGRLYRALYGELGVHGVPCAIAGPDGAGWFRRPLLGPEGFKGLRVRSFGFAAQSMEKLGAGIALLFGADLYVALKTGSVDAAEVGTPYADVRQGLQQVAPIYYYPGWQQPATMFDVVLQQARWQKLGPDDRRAIEQACAQTLDASPAEDAALTEAALAEIRRQGVQVLTLPVAVVAELRAAWLDLAEAEAGRDPEFAQVYRSAVAFKRSHGGSAD